jgi:hypothetical protein
MDTITTLLIVYLFGYTCFFWIIFIAFRENQIDWWIDAFVSAVIAIFWPWIVAYRIFMKVIF